ncbi:uncharacterized protein LOC120251488 [Dioscorea cayenensis subsp. rotundata]|uniref:Uncharacterized protein LOC120251488 n=1 Tax=Dioscorea cayennensis subsp. rotundata TaxID=55577 RepID=A0AB40AMF6_DIOCR|nr:uncharacterized protein LOC120251488 [Dioscorea cayenensis subsp. rotundata]
MAFGYHTNKPGETQFKMMNMMCDRHEHCQKWDNYLCPTIHKKIEDIVEESRALVIGRSDGEHFEVIDNQSNSLVCVKGNVLIASGRFMVSRVSYACAAIMLTDTNVYRFIKRYHTVNLFQEAYANQIFPIPDLDKPRDDNRVRQLRPPIAKKRPGRPRRRRIELQAFGV